MHFSSKIVDLTNHNKESSSVSAFQLFFLSKQSWAFTTGIHCWHPKLEQNTSHTMMCTILKESFFFCDSCSWVSCLSWTVKLSTVLQKKPFPALLCILTLSNYDCTILRSIFSHRGQLRDSYASVTEDSNTHWCSRRKKICIKSQGVKTFEQKELKMCIFFLFCLNIIFFHLVLPFRSYRR